MTDIEWKHTLTSLAHELDGVFFDIDAPEESIKKVEAMFARKPATPPAAERIPDRKPEVFGEPTTEQSKVMSDFQSLSNPPEGVIFCQQTRPIAGYKMSETVEHEEPYKAL